jgi:hypothetical protein
MRLFSLCVSDSRRGGFFISPFVKLARTNDNGGVEKTAVEPPDH